MKGGEKEKVDIEKKMQAKLTKSKNVKKRWVGLMVNMEERW